ncbi:hypothetical protein J6590_104340, partial [Homalodisca vitripennis]
IIPRLFFTFYSNHALQDTLSEYTYDAWCPYIRIHTDPFARIQVRLVQLVGKCMNFRYSVTS